MEVLSVKVLLSGRWIWPYSLACKLQVNLRTDKEILILLFGTNWLLVYHNSWWVVVIMERWTEFLPFSEPFSMEAATYVAAVRAWINSNLPAPQFCFKWGSLASHRICVKFSKKIIKVLVLLEETKWWWKIEKTKFIQGTYQICWLDISNFFLLTLIFCHAWLWHYDQKVKEKVQKLFFCRRGIRTWVN